ncbi:MAG: PadR family transcriptional regulator [Candidatus Heimdallarchaeota archaeon]|nr:PadR family transcriptional regulator [Candidatus Heimdallarchaeota archaeon]
MIAEDLLERWTIEFKRGFAKPLILMFLKNRESYPNKVLREINDRTNGAISIAGSNIYPLLKSMEEDGLIITKAVDQGKIRKLYMLTSEGDEYLESLRSEMTDFLKMMLDVITEEQNND